jgi:serine/threonine protein kinase
MSPEVVNKQNYRENIDIWSLGILLFEITHGFTPFESDNKEEILYKIKNQEISLFLKLVIKIMIYNCLIYLKKCLIKNLKIDIPFNKF